MSIDGCDLCTGGSANRTTFGGPFCFHCTGLCIASLTHSDDAVLKVAQAEAREVERAYFKSANPSQLSSASFEVPVSELAAIAQRNPVAAGALLAFNPKYRNPVISLTEGAVSVTQNPSVETVVSMARGHVQKDDAMAATLSPLPSNAAFIETRWSSARIKDGLRVIFKSNYLDKELIGLGKAYPSIVVDFSDKLPTSVQRWTVQE